MHFLLTGGRQPFFIGDNERKNQMPNKHHESKSKLTVWTEDELKKQAQAILKKRGLTLTDEITNLLIKIIKEDKENENKTTR